jgi:O-antigen/teichoic acid export membrane protein
MTTPRRGGVLLTQAAAYTGALFLLRAGNFLLVPLYTSMLSAAEYGIVGVLQQIVAVLATLALCGQQTASLQLGLRLEQEPEARRRLASTQWTFVTGVGVGLTALGMLLWPLLGVPIGEPDLWPRGVVALFGVAAQASFLLQLSWRQQAGRAREHTTLNLLRWACMVSLALLFVLGFRMGAAGILLATALSYWFGTLLGFRGTRNDEGDARPQIHAPRLQIDRALLHDALKLGLPVLPHALAGVAFVTTDRTLLAAHEGAAAAGHYTLAVSLSAAILLLGQGLHSAWAPYFLRVDLEHREQGWDRARSRSFFILCAVAGASAWLGLLSPEIITVMAPPSYAIAAAFVPLLCVTNFVRAYYQVVVAIVLAEGTATRFLAMTTVPAALLNLVLNAIWIPKSGAMGAIAAMFLTYAASSLGAVVLARHARKVPLKYARAFLLLPMLAGVLWLGDGQSLGVRVLLGLAFVGALVGMDVRDTLRELAPLLARVRKQWPPQGTHAPP